MIHQIIKGLKKIRKKYKKISHILVSITKKIQNPHLTKKDWEKFEQNDKETNYLKFIICIA